MHIDLTPCSACRGASSLAAALSTANGSPPRGRSERTGATSSRSPRTRASRSSAGSRSRDHGQSHERQAPGNRKGNRTKHSPHAIILVQRCALGHSATTDPPGAAANIAAASRQRERAVMVKPSRFRLFDHWRDVAIVAIDSWLETWSGGGGIEPRPKRRASERIAPVRLRKASPRVAPTRVGLQPRRRRVFALLQGRRRARTNPGPHVERRYLRCSLNGA